MLIADKHCSDICCDKFPVPQIGRKSKQVKEQWHGKFYLQSVWGKLAILNIENMEISRWTTKVETIKMQNGILIDSLLILIAILQLGA